MSLYSTYDDFYAHNPDPRTLGGRNRASGAVRDKYGRFLPTEPWRQNFQEPTEPHGKAGGVALVEKRGREWMQSIGRRGAEATNAKVKATKEADYE